MAFETSATDVELIDEMRDLREELRTLRDAIDELREQLSYMFNVTVHTPCKRKTVAPSMACFR